MDTLVSHKRQNLTKQIQFYHLNFIKMLHFDYVYAHI